MSAIGASLKEFVKWQTNAMLDKFMQIVKHSMLPKKMDYFVYTGNSCKMPNSKSLYKFMYSTAEHQLKTIEVEAWCRIEAKLIAKQRLELFGHSLFELWFSKMAQVTKLDFIWYYMYVKYN